MTSKNSNILFKSSGSKFDISPIGTTKNKKPFKLRAFSLDTDMYYTYVLQSLVDPNYYYKGHCENLEKRLVQHNSGATKSIKNRVPFKIVYFEEFEQLKDAVKREKYFKTAAGRRFLKLKLAP